MINNRCAVNKKVLVENNPANIRCFVCREVCDVENSVIFNNTLFTYCSKCYENFKFEQNKTLQNKILKNKNVYEGVVAKRHLKTFDSFNGRLCENTLMKDRLSVAKIIGSNQIVRDKQGKPFYKISSCGSIYCNDEYCFNERFQVAKMYYNVLFFFNDCFYNSKVMKFFPKTDKMSLKYNSKYHISLNAEYIDLDKLTKSKLQSYKTGVNNVLKFLKKNVEDFKDAVGVLDFAYNPENKQIRPHYHLALTQCKGLKDFLYAKNKNTGLNNSQYRDFKQVCKKNNFGIIRNHGYKTGIKPLMSLISYFAQRKAGLYHFNIEFKTKLKDYNTLYEKYKLNKNYFFMFKDIISKESFFNSVYGFHRYVRFNLPNRADKKAVKKFKDMKEAFANNFEIVIGGETQGVSLILHSYEFYDVLSALGLSKFDISWVSVKYVPEVWRDFPDLLGCLV